MAEDVTVVMAMSWQRFEYHTRNEAVPAFCGLLLDGATSDSTFLSVCGTPVSPLQPR